MKKNNKVKTLLTLSKTDFFQLLEAFRFYHTYQLTLLLPYSTYKNKLGILNAESTREIDAEQINLIKRVAWAVKTVGKYSPWRNKCLAKAMTAQKMLKKRGFESTLYLGVKKTDDNSGKAHAWLRCGHLIVTGGDIMSEYTEIARFSWEKAIKKPNDNLN